MANWRNESAYPQVEETLLSRWHWEFLRRNHEYQRDYESYRALQNDSTSQRQCEELARKYGLDGIMLDYREPMEALFRSPRNDARIRLIQWHTDWVGEDKDGKLIEGTRKDLDYLNPRIRQHECCIVINLRNPIDQQLELARERVQKLQQRHMEKRGQIKNYSYYLRLIDADDDGVSIVEMVEYFLPDTERKIGLKKMEHDLIEASRLRDIDYRYI
ncbi:MAG: transcriptional regulator domain-containing protein [Gammaproteobacteria bacterium]